ncbi:MAG: bifunctional UDP-N-acetylmuramoyl-L-alanyl-D-glutamate--2,6-diaminopimelate ligase MurE/UDP-N-acetylmuramoyl-tripeptide--D-alanyl-D-alanine ligase MurF [Burkholderiales bacterium]|nr:bifunctional UDP-N-acetylmuramoyl-L-alanyl-D-glutamate--2,6-diaminopimelate ligase MurE/UDP-N-acetylmuramoyl-tripeptide--D-alanyl-D-alanine ligase MurF [Burkholderiales bacterium]
MNTSTLILNSAAEALVWLRQQGVQALTVDSRAVPAKAEEGVGFIAWPGAARDGRAFVVQALKDGARACLVEAEGVEAFALGDARVAALPGLKAASAEIAHGFFGAPSAQLDVVAVTGTNGKTSTSWWTAQALSAVARPCGVIGTLGVGRPGGGDFVPTGLTTPDPITLHATLRRFLDQGCQAAAIEASSIGLQELRLHATRIAVVQFTNFTQDHLDYHGSMDAYWAAKRALFDWPGLRAAVVNLDDPMGESVADGVRARGLDLWTYGLVHTARLQATGLSHHAHGMAFTLVERSEDLATTEDHIEVNTHLLGDFNASNLLAVIGALRALGVPLTQAVVACEHLGAVPGRMQQVSLPHVESASLPLAVVDYAHTPDALKKALQALRPLAQARGGRLWCVFGCGGNRDPIKRPLMGAIAEQQADQVVLTSDNPRDEAPCFILSQVMAGIARHDGIDVIDDRREAIADALKRCADQDVVLIAGKGHETTQEVAGVKAPFSDVDEARRALGRRSRAGSRMMTLGLAHQLLPGSALSGDPQTPLLRVHTDTRTLQQGDLFVALCGERFDAHDFLPQARGAGAVAALVQRGIEASGLPGLTVADTRAALGWLAAAWRSRFDIPLVAVTGSNGKTTVTQMVASIFQAWVSAQGRPEASLATQGNFNNEIGLPLTLLRLREGAHQCAVVELGMNHPGEINHLAAIAAPTVALVNNAQREHQEFMHTVEAVARENGAVLQALSRGGVAVFPADDPHASIWRQLANGCRVMDFAMEGSAAVTGQASWQAQPTPHWVIALNTPQGAASVNLRMAGVHNVRNALAATAAALGAGVPLTSIVAGLEAFEPVKGRSQLRCIERQGRAITVIDDSYNANPDSVRAAIDMLAGLPSPRWLVLGDMGEVGTQGPAFHDEVGRHARDSGIEHVWTAGSLCLHAAQAYGPAARHFNNAADIVAAIHSAVGVPQAASVLVKGSRFMKMEQVVVALSGGAHAA